jgi:DNA-binding beta-propeller fold protein YncE
MLDLALEMRGRPLLAVLAALLLAAVPPAAADGEGFRFGAYRTVLADLGDPTRVVIDERDRIHVLEAAFGRISVFDAAGRLAARLAEEGSAPGQLLRPAGIALHDGLLYVADTGNDRIQVLDDAGAVQAVWGGHGREAGAFSAPSGIAVHGERVFVADLGNDRVQVLDRKTGAPLATVGEAGDGDGAFRRPLDVAVDDRGHLYVADADNNRIQEFDASLAFVRAWGDWGPFRGLMDHPGAIVHRDGHLYVADTRNHRVQVFGLDGALVREWGTHAVLPHEGEGALHYPADLAIAASGRFGVICERFENRCQVFDVAIGEAETLPPVPAARMRAHFGSGIDTDGVLLALTEPENHRLYVLEMSKDIPIVIGEYGERGRRFGQMIRMAGADIDLARRTILVGDSATQRLQSFRVEFDPEARRGFSPRRVRFATAIDLDKVSRQAPADLGVQWTIEPAAMVRAGDGRLYVADARNSMVLVFDESLRLESGWGGHGTAVGKLRRPSGIALSRSGETVFVVDANNHRIQAFSLDGEPRATWGGIGDAPGAFRHARGIAAGRDGFVYVTDSALHRVQKFTEGGELVATWGSLGVDHGEFWKPSGIAQDERERIIVVDEGNHRCQIFGADGEWLVTFGTGRAYTKWDRSQQSED